MQTSSLAALAVATLLAAPAVADEGGSPFAFRRSPQGVSLTEGGRPVLFYQLQEKSLDGKWPRSNYLHPLYGLDGEVLTEDFPADHRHHRGVFWAWHQLKQGGRPLADPWVCQGIQWLPPESGDGVKLQADADRAVLQVDRQWSVSGDGRPQRVAAERMTVTAHASTADLRRLDFELRLRALVDDLAIGGSENAKGYGGFCVRLRLDGGVRFVGRRGEVTPRTTAVDAAGPWLDMQLAGSATHVALLCHSSHPGVGERLERAAPAWILRSRRSMQNVAWPGREAAPLSVDDELVLRYRLLLHRREMSRDELDRQWREYATAAEAERAKPPITDSR